MNDQAFDAWVQRAREHDLLFSATQFGAKLRRSGAEHIGPCPACGGTDRFSVHPGKRAWNCRGFGGGHDAIGLVIHIASLSFLQACEALSGEPPPGRTSRPLGKDEIAAIEESRRRVDAARVERERRVETYRAGRSLQAVDVLAGCRPIAGTLAETYLLHRGLIAPPSGWPDCLMFSPSLYYELDGHGLSYPALVARVDDIAGSPVAVWRIFLSPDGKGKAPVEKPKLGLGAAAGGAVRIGGTAAHISLAEGIETALAVWALTGFWRPCWASLSTSGMAGIELPVDVARISVYPDGDRPCRLMDGEYIACEPPGRRAARTLRDRLAPTGIKVTIEAEPRPDTDYADVWLMRRSMEAA